MSRWFPLLLTALWVGCTADSDETASTPAPPASEPGQSAEAVSPDLEGGPAVEPDAELGDGSERAAVLEGGSRSGTSGNKPASSKGGSASSSKDLTPYQALSDWVGEYPVLEDGTHFVTQPAVRLFLEDALRVEPGLMETLGALATEPVFLAEPIEYIGGAFALEFLPNEDVGDEDRSLYVLIDGETGTTYAVLNGDGDTYYRSSYDARVADLEDEAVAWMREVSGEDVRVLGGASEDAPTSP